VASKALKGLTIEIGADTTDLTKALDKVEKQGRSLSSELGQINKLLKLDPKNTELLAQKQKVLADAISNTEKKLGTLKEAEKQVQAQFERGEVSEEQVRALQREIIETEAKLNKYKNAAKETADAVEDLGDNSKKAAGKIEDQEEAAKDGAEALEKLKEGASTAAKVGFAALAAAAVGAVAGIKSVVEETAEYRNEMAKLDTAFTKNGHSSEAATETYKELQSILGETDQAVEAANFIAKLTKNEEDLAKWTEVATGVYGEFGASLPIEGLMEAANETAKVGQVTGPLADALNWAAEEGETFGVVLKENIDFTELSKKELDKLTDSQKAEYEARKKQYDEIEAYNKKVEEAASAEDKFNIALENCTTEQERQQLILDTLTGKYSEAAETFKETNKEVIDQNKATERLNSLWAKVGKKAAPVVTTFTEGIADLVEAFLELIEDVDLEPFMAKLRNGFRKISQDVIPKLIDALEWCAENFDLLKSIAIGFIAAIATKKILTFATTVSTTLVNALKAGTAGFTKMNAAANANVYVALASAIIGVATALHAHLSAKAEEARQQAYDTALAMYGMSDAAREMTTRVNESAEAFKAQREAMDGSIAATESQFGYLSTLKDELFNLAGAQGRVAENDVARAQFIVNELNDKLGLEVELVGNVILAYDDLKKSIEDVILTKKTEMLLGDSEEAYIQAVKGKTTAEEDYYAAVAALQDAKIQRAQQGAEVEKKLEEAQDEWFKAGIARSSEHTKALRKAREERDATIQALDDNLAAAEKAYNDSRLTIEGYHTDIGQYETASRLSLEGNTAEAARVLADRGYYMEQYADKVGFENEEIMNTWELEARTAGVQAEATKTNWEEGTRGYTDEMVKEAKDGYKAALDAMNNAYNDAYGVGSNLGAGLTDGWFDEEGTFIDTVVGSVQSAISAAKRTALIKSPSRKMMQIGDYMGQGLEVGIEETTPDVEKAAERQAQSVIAAYDGLRALDSKNSLKMLEVKEESRVNKSLAAATKSNAPILEKILTTLEQGQVIALDSDILVGATADKMDSALGRRRVLASRGAI
jgi:phage-related minor tail protein